MVEARRTGSDCNCKLLCFSKLSEEDFTKILCDFNELPSKDSQDLFLTMLIEKREVHRRRKSSVGETLPKKLNFYSYNIKVRGTVIPACKKAFIAVHGITSKRVERLCNLISEGNSPRDLRGKKTGYNSIDLETGKNIHDFLSSLEVKESHYSGRHKKYLDARLSIKILYEKFKLTYPSPKVGYDYFRIYFRENFDYSFGRPQVDVCLTCEELKVKLRSKSLADNVKRSVAAELLIHQRRAKKFYGVIKNLTESMKNDDFRKKNLALCYDYMQNLPLPNIPVQDMFYLRQLWVNTFGIHDLATGKVDLHVYHEGVARKTPNEVCTFLVDYIIRHKTVEHRQLYLISDGCSGQNKNHSLLRMCMALVQMNMFESIEIFFPVRGHSFLPCDRDFGTVKRLIRRTDRIYTPDQYCDLMEKASKTGRFTIIKVTTDQIKDFKKWWPLYFKKSCISDNSYGRNVKKEDKIMFKISLMRHFVISNNNPGKVKASPHINNSFSENTFTLRKKTAIPMSLPSEHAYSDKIPINTKKMKDISKCIQYIPEETEIKQFYDTLMDWPTEENCASASEGEED